MYNRCISFSFIVTVQTAGKQGQKQVSSLLVNMVLPLFTHRMDIRCFLSGLWPGKKTRCPLGYARRLNCYKLQKMISLQDEGI